MKLDLKSNRNEYSSNILSEKDLNINPIVQAQNWIEEAIASKEPEATAMTLATTTHEGKPSAGIVLLKQLDERGFIFFSNYNSRKGKEIELNKFAAILFFRPSLQRQMRAEGKIIKLPEVESDNYFNERPFEGRIAACISPQSEVIPDRTYLDQLFERKKKQSKDLKRPGHWGGYILVPGKIEFWQGREKRLHDRFLYKQNKGTWKISRLAP